MRTTSIPQVDRPVSVVGFGCWALSGPEVWTSGSDAAGTAAVRRAVELGINFFDVAPVYGLGHAEAVLGSALRGSRDDVVIATAPVPLFVSQVREAEAAHSFRAVAHGTVVDEQALAVDVIIGGTVEVDEVVHLSSDDADLSEPGRKYGMLAKDQLSRSTDRGTSHDAGCEAHRSQKAMEPHKSSPCSGRPGSGRPRCCQPFLASIRPRGVRAIRPCCKR